MSFRWSRTWRDDGTEVVDWVILSGAVSFAGTFWMRLLKLSGSWDRISGGVGVRAVLGRVKAVAAGCCSVAAAFGPVAGIAGLLERKGSENGMGRRRRRGECTDFCEPLAFWI
jgi:hypothetical protein